MIMPMVSVITVEALQRGDLSLAPAEPSSGRSHGSPSMTSLARERTQAGCQVAGRLHQRRGPRCHTPFGGCALGGAALLRTTRVGAIGVRSTSLPSIAPTSTSMLISANAVKSWRTVVSGGRK